MRGKRIFRKCINRLSKKRWRWCLVYGADNCVARGLSSGHMAARTAAMAAERNLIGAFQKPIDTRVDSHYTAESMKEMLFR